MAVTSARTGFDYNVASGTLTTPTGTGGILVVIGGFRGDMAPSTPADWNGPTSSTTWGEAAIKVWWAVASGAPDMQFAQVGASEWGGVVLRIPDADVASPDVQIATDNNASGSSGLTIPDVTTAPDGTAILALGQQDSQTLTSTSAGYTEVYDGDIGAAGWWAADMSVAYLEGVTPGGGTYSGGTYTNSGGNLVNEVSLVVKTASGATNHAISASGSGASGGGVALTAQLVLAAGGSGTSGGAVALIAELVLSAAGSGASGGSAAINLSAVLDVATTGSGTTGGSATVNLTLGVSASGSGVSAGAVALVAELVLSAAGSGSTGGSVAITAYTPEVLGLSSAGLSLSGGDVSVQWFPILDPGRGKFFVVAVGRGRTPRLGTLRSGRS